MRQNEPQNHGPRPSAWCSAMDSTKDAALTGLGDDGVGLVMATRDDPRHDRALARAHRSGIPMNSTILKNTWSIHVG